MHRSNFPIILIVALVFAAIGSPTLAWAKRVALVVGIDQYDHLAPSQQLKKAVSDSEAMGEALRSLGYEVEQAENVTRLDFLRQWQRFLNRIEAGDEAALYFAGHGVEIGGLNFLLPADVPGVASGEEEVLKASALSLSDFLDQVRERKPQTMLYVLDACRDNPFVSSTGRSIGGTRGLTLIEPPSGTFVMFSAGAGETALDRLSDDDTDPNSVYTRVLVPRLKAPGKIGDIARDVRRSVRKLAARVNHVQTPAFYDEVLGDFCPSGCIEEAKIEARDAWLATQNTESVSVLKAFIAKYKDSFYAELAKAKAEELKRKQELAKAAAPKSPRPGPDPAHQAWTAIKGTQNVAVLETFIDKYPLSFYAELARVQLSELKRKQQAALVAPPPKLKPPVPDPALQAWNATRATESVATLEAFIGNYPKSFYAELAKARLSEIKRKQKLAAVAPAKLDTPPPDPALEAWNVAKASDSVSVLETFVDRYPDSFYAEVARARIEELKRKEQEASHDATVREVQETLRDLNCYNGPVDGIWGRGSRAALDRFGRLAKLDPAPQEPLESTLASLKAWNGEHCPVERAKVPRQEKPAAVARKRPPANAAKTRPPSKAATAPRPSTPKVRSAGKPASEKKRPGYIEDFDSGSVYCGQGCAGGFTNVMKGTATNPGMKR